MSRRGEAAAGIWLISKLVNAAHVVALIGRELHVITSVPMTKFHQIPITFGIRDLPGNDTVDRLIKTTYAFFNSPALGQGVLELVSWYW